MLMEDGRVELGEDIDGRWKGVGCVLGVSEDENGEDDGHASFIRRQLWTCSVRQDTSPQPRELKCPLLTRVPVWDLASQW